MAYSNISDIFRNSFLGEFKRPELGTDRPFNPDSAYGANMVRGSNRQNPNAGRDFLNGQIGSLTGGNSGPGLPGMTSPISSPMGGEGISADRFEQLMRATAEGQPSNYLDNLYEGKGQPFSQSTTDTMTKARGFNAADIPGIAAMSGLQMLPRLGQSLGGPIGGLAGSGLKLGAEAGMAFAQPEVGVPMLTMDAIRFLSSLF